MENKSKELEVAIAAALAAGKILEKYFESEIEKEYKDDKSIVTAADKESEEIIKKIISKAFPGHSILGEETGHTDNSSKYTWHIDPVDGTANFANHIPMFAVSIALSHKDELIVGVIYNPACNLLYFAENGKGAYCNNKKIHVSDDNANHSKITASASRHRGEATKKLFRDLLYYLPMTFVPSTRDFGCAAMNLAFVASGGLEADIELGLNTYDFAAGVLLVKEAGGRITDLDGKEWKFPANFFVASNGIFHDELIKEIKKHA
jgi:myo-inositol-1(or 4)-monophosphatase